MFTRFAAALCALHVLSASVALAHETHEAEPSPRAAAAGPRAAAVSKNFELVAVPRDGHLVLYLDRFATNEPVADARIDIETPDGTARAEAIRPGTYRIDPPWLAGGGDRELAVTVAAAGWTEVLDLDLHLPEPAAPGAAANDEASAALRAHLAHQTPVGAAAGGFLLGLATIMLGRARRTAGAVTLLAATLTLLLGGAALADEGHGKPEASASTPAAASSEEPLPAAEPSRRLPDGSVFVPKSAQHLLAIRTGVAVKASHRRTVELPGRVIADPNASGVVQSSVGGRLAPPQGGFPELGARVRRGDLLATVTPPVQAVDQSDMRQTQGNLDQQIAIVERRVTRYERLAASGAVAQTALDDARAELSGLKDRRAALDRIRREPEALVAPVDGVVAERSAVAGQMASPGTMIFRIVDPSRLYIEALSFEAPESGAEATARLADGRQLRLLYRGAGLADRNQAVPVQFAVVDAAESLRMGQFVTVLAPTGETARGLALPRAGVLRSDGGTIVYEHVAAERFEPRLVTAQPLDAERVLVTKGVAADRRIVTQGADLIDQVR